VDSLRHPVGRLPAAVYWRRRLIVVAALLAALALVLYACSGSSGKKKQPVGTSSPTGAVSTDTAAGPGGSPSSSGATPPASADSSAGGSASPSGGVSGGTNGGATGTAGGPPSGTAAPGSCQLKLSLVSSSHDYINGEQPQFSVAVVNGGSADCTADLGPKSLVLTVFSGSDRVWSTADCGGDKQDLRALRPSDVQQVSITWPRTRSVPGCAGGNPAAPVGTYYAQATLGTGTGTPQAATVTTSQQTFVLKTGS
jgi:hypothetical protein